MRSGAVASINKKILKSTLFSLILFPSISVFSWLPSIRVDDWLLLLWFVFFIFYSKVQKKVLLEKRVVFLIIFSVFFLVSMLNGAIGGFDSSFSDLNQYVRFIKYISMYCLSYLCLVNIKEEERKKMVNLFMMLGAALSFISISQYFNFLGLNAIYIPSVAPTQYEQLVNNHANPRPVGMIGNPNELGFIMVIMSLIAAFNFAYYKNKFSIAYFSLFLFVIFLTMSRSSLLSLFLGCVVFLFVAQLGASAKKKFNMLFVFLVMVTVAVYTAVQPLVYEKITWRFVEGAQLSDSRSVQARLDNWSENLSIATEHPIVGVGPLRRAKFEHASDNEWLLMWRSYGVIGCLIFILIMTAGIFSRSELTHSATKVSIVAAVFLYMIPAAAFHSLVLFPIVLFVLALFDTSNVSEKSRN